MKTLILNGSPRISGDTVSLIKLIALGLKGDMIIRNGIVIQDSTLLLRPLILTLVLGTIYFGSGKIKKGGISPILLICLSAVAGIAAYGL